MTQERGDDKVRLDKWLWAARFFKTRANAAEAVSGGKVHVNGARVKPARTMNLGDEVSVRRLLGEAFMTYSGPNALARAERPAESVRSVAASREDVVA